MTGQVLAGPFLTRPEAAELAGLDADDLPFRPDLLRIGGHVLPEAYFAFQFGRHGIRRDIGTVVLAMRGNHCDLHIADWLVTPNPALRWQTPLLCLDRTHRTAQVLEALRRHGPKPTEPPPIERRRATSVITSARRRAVSDARTSRRRRRAHFGRPAPSH